MLPVSSCRSRLMAVFIGVASIVPAGLLAAATSPAQARKTLAITYDEGTSTKVDLLDTSPRRAELGQAEIERKSGRTRVKLQMQALPHPQSHGAFFTTYVLWAVAPEGRAMNLAALPSAKSTKLDVTTPFQTFGLIVTAEPHEVVALPSPLIVAETALRDDTQGRLRTATLEYSGATGGPYDTPGAWTAGRDFATPLAVLGARRAVELAQAAQAAAYAKADLQQAGEKLAALESAWQRNHDLPKALASEAREVMRLAEHARVEAEQGRAEAGRAAERRSAEAKLAAERRNAEAQVARAEDQAEAARQEAEQAQAGAAQARAEEQAARLGEQQARAGQLTAEARADQARREVEDVRRDQEQLRQKLYESLAAVVETRREARGLVVSLSEVLFDFDRASIRPEARERLSKLAGILLAYPGNFRLDFEGHTDAVGSPNYNLRLSVERAESVRSYLLLAGVPPERVGVAVGRGPDVPVASNSNDVGRQLNRRVEIVITELA